MSKKTKGKNSRRSKKPHLWIFPNPVTCIHGGANRFGLVCFARGDELVHVDCWRAHFKVPKPSV